MLQLKTIVCATDFSKCAAAAVGYAVDLARELHASIVLVHVLPDVAHVFPGPDMPGVLGGIVDSARGKAREALKDMQRRIEGVTVRAVLSEGTTHDCILAAAADEKADLIVVGTHGRTGVKHVLLGSVAERIVRLSPIPVLTVRGPA
jgi:nucleotide-binding universal stress UspA family protein